MQLFQIHFYQKIARKKVARVNAALCTQSTITDQSWQTGQIESILHLEVVF